MKSTLLNFAILILIIGCSTQKEVKIEGIPENWIVGDIVSDNSFYYDPPVSEDSSRIQFWGLIDSDREGYRLYSIPAETQIEEIVRIFKVGFHAETSYGLDPEITNQMVAENAKKINEIIPSRVIFADAAGLKLKFLRQVTKEDLEKIEVLLPSDRDIQMGLERYTSEWDFENSLFLPLLEENLIHFWWD